MKRPPGLRSLLGLPLALAALAAGACAKPPPLTEPTNPKFAGSAPDSFDVLMETSKGPLTVRVHRDWAPRGADRFYGLVRGRYFDGVAFFRVIRGFVAQFGLHGDPAVAAAWEKRAIPDDSTRTSNARGTLSFAHDGPGTRSTQMFFNLRDNAQLDHMAPAGFAPIGRVTDGLPVLDALYYEYSSGAGRELPGPNQDSISAQGRAYLRREFPRLDSIETARVIRAWK